MVNLAPEESWSCGLNSFAEYPASQLGAHVYLVIYSFGILSYNVNHFVLYVSNELDEYVMFIDGFYCLSVWMVKVTLSEWPDFKFGTNREFQSDEFFWAADYNWISFFLQDRCIRGKLLKLCL